MSHGYQAVLWNSQKRRYDMLIVGGVVFYLGLFMGLGSVIRPQATAETLIIRAFGTLAMLLLHVILSIGPLCRLEPRLLPLLYNRRHLGVTMFLAAAVHGGFSIVQFHGLGDTHPLVSLLSSNGRLASLAQFPFQPLGFFALIILFLMAATSHDFWLANLTAPVWKSLHMLVYLAYGLLVLHVALGALQAETSPLLSSLLVVGFSWIVGIHLLAGFRERRADTACRVEARDGYVRACAVDTIKETRARIVCLGGERVAIFRHDGKISAVSNVCQHQNGPLGEGKVVDGCITCPWHGYQYVTETGASPPPFTEKIPTFNVRVRDREIWIDPVPNPPGTRVEPAQIDGGEPVGYLDDSPSGIAVWTRRAVVLLLALGLGLGLLLVAGQARFDFGVFEFGVDKSFEGIIIERPYRMLLVHEENDEGSGITAHYLVASGKHGATSLVDGMDSDPVRITGSLIYNDSQRMIEVHTIEHLSGSLAEDLRRQQVDGEQGLGTMTLTGEIVGTKCYLGVMKPGRGKTHKACAIRCISGGVPPVLRVEDHDGRVEHFLPASADGQAVNRRVLDMIAEPVEVTGEVARSGDLLILYADPETYRRVGPQ